MGWWNGYGNAEVAPLDGVANICAAMNYLIGHYGVHRDGSNLAGRVPQFDPSRDGHGY